MNADIRAWSVGDPGLLQRLLGDAELTRYLGGPESEEQIRARHRRYLTLEETGNDPMFVIDAGQERVPAGSPGYWEKAWPENIVREVGRSVLPGYQGMGLATQGARLAIERARQANRHRYIHAYPSIENAASNAICQDLGFSLMDEHQFDYPPVHLMRCNDWRLDLLGPNSGNGETQVENRE